MGQSQEEFETRVQKYVNLVSYLQGSEGDAEAEFGRKYVKVYVINVYGRKHVHTFINLENGDILKAATYQAPAKNGVRGNIWAEDLGASVINSYGAKYLSTSLKYLK